MKSRGATGLLLVAISSVLVSCLSAERTGSGGEMTPPGGGSSAAETAGAPSTRDDAFVNGGECPETASTALPEGAGCVTAVEGDADGDGAPDEVALFARLGPGSLPVSWHLQLTSDRGAFEQQIDAGHPSSYPRVLGATDVDGDGRDEFWVKIYDLAGHGTNWQRTNLFVLDRERLRRVTFEDAPLDMNVGGISRMGEGVSCRGGELVLLRAEAKNVKNTRWRYSERTYSLDGTEAIFEERTEGWLRLDHYNDPDLDPYYRIECGPVSYP